LELIDTNGPKLPLADVSDATSPDRPFVHRAAFSEANDGSAGQSRRSQPPGGYDGRQPKWTHRGQLETAKDDIHRAVGRTGKIRIHGAERCKTCYNNPKMTEVSRMRIRVRAATCLVAYLMLCTELAAGGHEETLPGKWSVGMVAGNMTKNRANDLLRPGEYDFADNYFAGVLVAYDRQIGDSKWSLGAEFQLNFHFGKQEFLEFVLPATIRYRPELSFLPALESLGFGLGLSHTTGVPKLEVEVRGESARTLVYWLAESAFSVGNSGDELFLRVHHRSDAFGLLDPDSGSNAFAIGWRRSF